MVGSVHKREKIHSLTNNSGVVRRLQLSFSLMPISLFKTTSSCFSSSLFSKRATRGLECKRDDEWNEAWETSWLPEEVVAQSRAPWEVDVHCDQAENPLVVFSSQLDPDTKAFVEEMNDNWDQRRGSRNIPPDWQPTLPACRSRRQKGTRRENTESGSR